MIGRFRRREARGIVADPRLAGRPDFAQWLAFGFTFTERDFADSVERLESATTRWRTGDESTFRGADAAERADQLDALLRAVVATAAGRVDPSRPTVLSLSGGHDSRAIAAAWPGPARTAVTYGRPGAVDFETARLVATAQGLPLTEFDVRAMTWDREALVVELAGQRDCHLSPRAVVQPVLDREIGPYALAHGLWNGSLTGSMPTPGATWADDQRAFARDNDRFAFQSAMGERAVLALVPRSPRSGPVAPPMQLRALHADLRIAPSSTPVRAMVLPFTDERWQGFWLNRDPAELAGRRLWLEFLASRHPAWFPELDRWDGVEPIRSVQRRWLAQVAPPREPGDLGPVRARGDLCWRSTYRDNPSFRFLVDDAVVRLRARRVLDDGFVVACLRAWRRGRPEGWRSLRGLVATELRLTAGTFD